MSQVLETKQVCKFYRHGSSAEVRAVDDVSLTVDAGSFVVLTGPSGSGKSTLLALLGALDRPTGGQVSFNGQDLTRCSDAALVRVRRRMGFIFQSFSLIPRLPVWENVTYPLVPRGIRAGERYRLATRLLASLGLESKIETHPEELSGGEQQRVAVARALAGEPEVLLADEPTSNLDRAAADGLIQIFRQLHGQRKTVIVSSHDPGMVAAATIVLELANGKLRGDSTPARSASEGQPG